jgi:hypothetical protein
MVAHFNLTLSFSNHENAAIFLSKFALPYLRYIRKHILFTTQNNLIEQTAR